MQRDWLKWHTDYQDAASPLAQRLRLVQDCLREALDRQPPGPVRLISLCAGEGLDVVGALADHPRRSDVHGRLVELDPRLVERAQAGLATAGLDAIHAVCADASLTDSYLGALPANLVLVCGVFGNISLPDIQHTIQELPQVCAADAEVIWTRHRAAPDRVPAIRDFFRQAGFAELALLRVRMYAVGLHRLTASPRPLEPGLRLFTFVGYDALRGQ